MSSGLPSSRKPSKFVHPTGGPPQLEICFPQLLVPFLQFECSFAHSFTQYALLRFAFFRHPSDLTDHAIELQRQKSKLIRCMCDHLRLKVACLRARHSSK